MSSELVSLLHVSQQLVQRYLCLVCLHHISLMVSVEQFNCALDGYARNGTGKKFPKFSAKAYLSIYHLLLSLIEDMLQHAYHGPHLSD